ncbi:diaminopimelate decarboxylase [Ramlibacter sp. Leaf400]|uniref:diaminopimelate decarboxylase n=1 Tax=Ramlibacter sp. Leaf400 TaxID=1736365 RepID=UPI0006FA90FB|nr:diaminopimelate decarboxylase [Ramlibacter sp. Leaf400]KQT09456.1 diaminopimelate decarboxylase [Ramlibacter sp. Leaf400]
MTTPGHPHFAWRDGALHVEQLRVAELAREHGTPLFVYSKASMLAALEAYRRGFAGRRSKICYAMKANSSLGILQVFAQAGCGFDIVSGGELERVLAVGAPARDIIFSGVGKTRAEMARALEVGIGCFNVESEAELEVLSEVAAAHGHTAPVSIRVNPNVDPKTHPYISTGLKGNKFGIAHERTLAAYRRAAELPGLRVVGIDCHIGSQITDSSPYLDAMDRVLDLVEAIEAAGIRLQHIDFGGGLGIDYQGVLPPAADQLWAQLLRRLDARGYGDRELMIEPGRSLVGNAGVCVTEVLYLKPGEQKNFCIVDAAMNDLPRPAMYEAFHGILPVTPRAQAEESSYDVVGPVCESGDWLGRNRSLAVQLGDLLAVLSAGAYCMSMASNYNTRPRAAEVLVDGDRAHLIREREQVSDLMRGERLVR